jgi:hypothetical protein
MIEGKNINVASGRCKYLSTEYYSKMFCLGLILSKIRSNFIMLLIKKQKEIQ